MCVIVMLIKYGFIEMQSKPRAIEVKVSLLAQQVELVQTDLDASKT